VNFSLAAQQEETTMNVTQYTPPGRATVAVATALTTTLALAAACWVISIRQMSGMDMGTATQLGSFAFFIALWVPMMAAMRLPGTAPAALRCARTSGRVRAVLTFIGAYLAIWAVVGVVVYALYRPHGTAAAGALVLAAGLYEITPLKRRCRRRCLESTGSGIGYGLWCVGSSIGLMVVMVALGVMSITWMAVVAVLAVTQKLWPYRAVIDVPLSLAIVGFGLFILIAAPTI
jgi:predicted metal-binding membrane protein